MEDTRSALRAATSPDTPTDWPDERHDVPAIHPDHIAACEDWLKQRKFLRPRTKDDNVWEKIKTNWIGFLAATSGIPCGKVAVLAPNRKVVQLGSAKGVETEEEREKRFQDDRLRRMVIQASSRKHFDILERYTEKWPQAARLALNSMDKQHTAKTFETWEQNKRRRTQSIWYSFLAFLLYSHDEGTLGDMGLVLDEEQADDVLGIKQQVSCVQPDQLSSVYGVDLKLLTGIIFKMRSTAPNNPLLWWICILVRSAVSGEVDFISSGRFNGNPLPMDLDLTGRMHAILHYAKMIVLGVSLWSWKDEPSRVAVQSDIDLHVDGGNWQGTMNDDICNKPAWIDRPRLHARQFLGGMKGTVLYRVRLLLAKALQEDSDSRILSLLNDNTGRAHTGRLTARKFAETTDLLMMLRSKIHDQETIYSLCNVNWQFHYVFITKLYQTLTWTQSNAEELRRGSSYGLQNTKTVTISRHGGLFDDCNDFSKDWESRISVWEALNAELAALVRRTTLVTGFVNHGFPLTGQTLESLRLSGKLRDLTLSVSTPALQHLHRSEELSERVPDVLPEIDTLRQFLPRFKNLRALRLYNMAIDLGRWSRSVAEMLQLNPQLEVLCLSICEQTEFSLLSQEHRWLFRDICSDYAEGGQKPLKLRTLELGGSLYFPEPEALSVLTDLRQLESVFVDNGIYHRQSVVPWNILSPKVTPNLLQIRLKCLDKDVCDGMQRLKEEGRVIDVFQASQFSCGVQRQDEPVCLARLLTTNQILQARCVVLPRGTGDATYNANVLKKLQNCQQITHLSLPLEQDPEAKESIDDVDEALALVYKMIEALKSLNAIQLPLVYCGEDEEDVEARKEACKPVLDRLVEACPSLQFVRLRMSTWTLRRVVTDNGSGIQMNEPDAWECDAMEPGCFRRSKFGSFQSTL